MDGGEGGEDLGRRGGSGGDRPDWLDPVDEVARSEAELLLVASMALARAPIHSLAKDVGEETASAAVARVSRVLVGGTREEHQIRSVEMVQRPEESPVERAKRNCSIRMGRRCSGQRNCSI